MNKKTTTPLFNNSIQSCPEREKAGLVVSAHETPDDFRQPGKPSTLGV